MLLYYSFPNAIGELLCSFSGKTTVICHAELSLSFFLKRITLRDLYNNSSATCITLSDVMVVSFAWTSRKLELQHS